MAASCSRGDLVFDIGAHVGDRVASFRRLGARVVAVEPQPALATTLKLLYGRDADVTIEATAVGRAPGTTDLMINRRQSDRVDGLARLHRRRARRARLGRRSAGRRTRRGAGDDARCADRAARRAGLHQDRRRRLRSRGAGRADAAGRRRCRSNSPPSSATSRSPASSAAWRSATHASTPRSAKARRSCMPTGSAREAIARWLTRAAACGQFRGRLCRSRLTARARRAARLLIAALR